MTAIAYELHSPATPPGTEPPTVVLLGSIGSTREMWRTTIGRLAPDMRVVAVDHRGHAGWPAPAGPATPAELASDLLAVLDSLGITRCHLVGLSLGGAVAQWTALRHPDRVESLVLLCTAARFGEPAAWRERATLVRDEGMSAVVDAVVARWVTPATAQADPALMSRLRGMVLSVDAEGYAACCDALSAFDVTDELGRIDVPTLVVAGDEDPATPPEVARVLADGIPGADLVVLANAAHVPTFEHGERVAELIAGHVRDATAAGRSVDGIAR